ncbi:MAG: hypothetical protein KDA34_14875 [Phycisphaerales bacterium]|nr:hypothetical protein [Phycisphaerales bacterium]
MESALWILFLLSTLLALDFALESGRFRAMALLGVVATLGFVTRTDSILFGLVAIGMMLLPLSARETSDRVRTIAAISISAAIVMALIGILSFNFIAAGSLFSVSAQTKLDWSTTGGALGVYRNLTSGTQLLGQALWQYFKDFGALSWGPNRFNVGFQLLMAVIVAIAAWCWWAVLRSAGVADACAWGDKHRSLLSLAVYTVLHSVMISLALGESLNFARWYMVPEIMAITFLFGRLICPPSCAWRTSYLRWRGLPGTRMLREIQWVGVSVCIAITVVAVGWSQQVHEAGVVNGLSRPSHTEELVSWLNERVTQDATIGLLDSGEVGYFSRSHVVNLDGLVQSPSFREYLKSNTIADYVIDQRLDYVIRYDLIPPPASSQYNMLGEPSPHHASQVCHLLIYRNNDPARWYIGELRDNYWEVIRLAYGKDCRSPYQRGWW